MPFNSFIDNNFHRSTPRKATPTCRPQFAVLLLLLASPLTAGTRPVAQATNLPADYRLVWQDDFAQNGPLNPHDWTCERGFVRNEELQWYQPDNATCADGKLIIEARRETVPNPHYDPTSHRWQTSRKTAEYTSASVTTRGLHEWLYGRFEIRARINTAPGSWPAFWTLGSTRRWPDCGEVDIMEFYKSTLLANIGWAKANHDIRWNSTRKPIHTFDDPAWSTKFHTWRMDWDEHEIALYVDDTLINRQDLSTTLNAGNPQDNPFHRPMYILLNQAIGGQGGDPANTPFPIRFEIEYVRVYQRPDQVTTTKP